MTHDSTIAWEYTKRIGFDWRLNYSMLKFNRQLKVCKEQKNFMKYSYSTLFYLSMGMVFVGYHIPMMAPMLSQEIADREKKKKRKQRNREYGDTLSTMSYEQLKKAKNELLARRDYFNAVKYLEEMVRVCDDHIERQAVMLELGDTWFADKDYKHALRVYKDFGTLYPGSKHVGRALAQAIECSFHSTLSYDRDQTQTEETLTLIQQFREIQHLFAESKEQVDATERQCFNLLFESEMGVARTYLILGNFKSAQKRIENVIKKFGTQVPFGQPRILEFKIDLAHAQKNPLDATKYQIELAQLFPEYTTSKLLIPQLPDLKLQLAVLEKEALPAAEPAQTNEHMANRF